MLAYPSHIKRTPFIVCAHIYGEAIESTTVSMEDTTTPAGDEASISLYVGWKTPKIPLYRYNGNYIISAIDLGQAEDLTPEQWNTSYSLPAQNEDGETQASSVTITDLSVGWVVYARVRIGRDAGGWGKYGYLKQRVALEASGGGSGSGSGGDMYKAVYDTNNNNIVDRAERAAWVDGGTFVEDFSPEDPILQEETNLTDISMTINWKNGALINDAEIGRAHV